MLHRLNQFAYIERTRNPVVGDASDTKCKMSPTDSRYSQHSRDTDADRHTSRHYTSSTKTISTQQQQQQQQQQGDVVAKENDRENVVMDRKLPLKYKMQHVANHLGFKNSTLVNLRECKKKYQNYQHGAQKRQVGFHLTLKDCIRLFHAKCYYCGLEARYNGPGQLSGIDRMDSDRAYTLDNVVSCCSQCNMAKGVMPVSDFESMALHITLQTIQRQLLASSDSAQVHSIAICKTMGNEDQMERRDLSDLYSRLLSFIHPTLTDQKITPTRVSVLHDSSSSSTSSYTEDQEFGNVDMFGPDSDKMSVANTCDEYILGFS